MQRHLAALKAALGAGTRPRFLPFSPTAGSFAQPGTHSSADASWNAWNPPVALGHSVESWKPDSFEEALACLKWEPPEGWTQNLASLPDNLNQVPDLKDHAPNLRCVRPGNDLIQPSEAQTLNHLFLFRWKSNAATNQLDLDLSVLCLALAHRTICVESLPLIFRAVWPRYRRRVTVSIHRWSLSRRCGDWRFPGTSSAHSGFLPIE